MTQAHTAGRLLGEGKYELLSPLGRGAMGSVWLARHVALDRMVAVKLLHAGLQLGRSLPSTQARRDNASERFLKEARTASLLRHKNTVQLLDYGADVSDRWLVMEYLEGKNLADELYEVRRLAAPRAIAIVTQVLAALAEAHDYGIVHRDLKPANVMLVPWVDDDGRETELAKVLDFGIATMMSDEVADRNEVAGTPEYMSPEQAQALDVDPRSDLYAAGVLLYHLLTGEPPFADSDPMQTMLAQVNREPTAPRKLEPSISPALEAVIMTALAKDPDLRPESARAMRSTLLALPEAKGLRPDSSPRLEPVSTAGVSTAPGTSSAPRSATLPYAKPQPSRPRKTWLWGTLGVLAAAAIAVPLVLSQAGDGESSPPGLARVEAERPVVTSAAPTAGERGSGEPVREGAPAPAETSRSAPDASLGAEPATPPPPSPAVAVAPAEAAPTPAEARSSGTPAESAAVADTAAHGADQVAPSGSPSQVAPSGSPSQVAADVRPSATASVPAREQPRESARPAPEAAARKKVEAGRPEAAAPPKSPETEPARGGTSAVAERSTAPAGPIEVAAGPTPAPSRVVPERPTPEPRPASLSASAAVTGFNARGSLPRSSVIRALDGLGGSLEACYASGARAAGRDAAGTLGVNVVYDTDGKVSTVQVSSYPLPGVSECVNAAVWRTRLRERPDTGSVDASFRIVFTPR